MSEIDNTAPATHTNFYPSGQIRYKAWRNAEGEYWRPDGGPCEITYFESGNIMSEQYYDELRNHRDDGPAVITYYPSGAKLAEIFMIHGYIESIDDKPGMIYYDEAGHIAAQFWYKRDKLHRTSSEGHVPAAVWYDEEGNVTREVYAKKGKQYEPKA